MDAPYNLGATGNDPNRAVSTRLDWDSICSADSEENRQEVSFVNSASVVCSIGYLMRT
jgi:hypothetical protein